MTGTRIGRPPILTIEAIAHAVIEVGFTDLTVAAVRDRLGVGHTTLYRYAADRDELVRIGLGHLLEHADWPARSGHWREVLDRYALALWWLWEAHPGAATEAARGILPAATLRLTDDLCAVLLRQGFAPDNAVLACDIVFDLVTDNRRGIEHHASSVAADSLQFQTLEGGCLEHVESESGHPATEAERRVIHAAMKRAVTADPLEWFTQKLRVALEGVECCLGPQSG